MSTTSPAALAPAAQPLAPSPAAALPDAVHWAEGMLLTPQHLQQNDLYWHEQLRFRLGKLAASGWGVAALEVDMLKLKAGVVALKRLECLMPDGTAVLFPGEYGTALELDVAADLARAPAALRISLVLPQRGLASGRPEASWRRHDAVEGPVAVDENTGQDGVPVDRLRPRLALWAGGAIPAPYLVCPLFELTRRAETGNVEFRHYHPPMLHWQASDFLRGASLQRRLHTHLEALWQKLRELGGQRLGDGPQEDDLLGADARRQLEQARRLAAVLPQVSLVAGRGDASPQSVYEALASLVGAMAGFGANPVPPVLDAYQHDNCEPQFRRAVEYIVRKLSYINTSIEFLRFDETEEGFSQLLPAEAGQELLVELRLPEGRTASHGERLALRQWMQEACIASRGVAQEAMRARLGARAVLLDGEAAARRNLRPAAVLFTIRNDTVELAGHGSVPLFAPGQQLVIQAAPEPVHQQPAGARPALLKPAAILLYQPRRAAGKPRAHG